MAGEFERIARFYRPLAARESGALALADDAAVLTVRAGQDLVVTTDALVEGVHFLADTGPADLAWKALAVNVSDLAAMAAVPWTYSVALATPEAVDEGWVAAFAAGLASAQSAFGIALVGGDSVQTPGPLNVTITAHGLVPSGQALRRSGARSGDTVFVTGDLGAGALGLLAAKGELDGLPPASIADLAHRYRRPEPRTTVSQAVRGFASAAMDLSDGIAGDAWHIAAASGIAMEIDLAMLPFGAAVRAALEVRPELWSLAAAGGDDYELLLTGPAELPMCMEAHSVPITAIGTVGPGTGVRFVRDGATVDSLKGWQHFS